MLRDYYADLGLTPGASQDDIIEAFYRLSRKLYPAAQSNPVAQAQLDKIAEAWQVLADRRQREFYDTEQRRERQGLLLRLARVPRRTRAGLTRSARQTVRELTASREKLMLIGMSALILFLVYVIAPAEQRAARAAPDAVQSHQSSVIPLEPLERIGPPAPTDYHGPLALIGPPAPTEPPPALVSTRIPSAATGEPEVWSDAAMWPTATATRRAPTATATRIPEKATAIPTIVPTLPPTATGTALDYKYAAPRLLAPSSGTHYGCARELVLRWSIEPGVTLAADEWFVVEARAIGRAGWSGLMDWTREETAALHPIKQGASCDLAGLPEGALEWQVQIIQGNHETHAIERFLSAPSAPFVINYGH